MRISTLQSFSSVSLDTEVPANAASAIVQTVQYIQPQHHARLSAAELLVIDEAAAIPLPLVKAMLGPYLVFLCSTVNGYEGGATTQHFPARSSGVDCILLRHQTVAARKDGTFVSSLNSLHSKDLHKLPLF
jgi:Helicase